MSILSWEKPQKVMSTKAWKNIRAEGAPPGVYVPNMSRADKEKWKAKHITGPHRRVVIRKSVGGTQIKIVVSLPGQPTYKKRSYKGTTPTKVDAGHNDNVVIGMNSTARFSFEEIVELQQAIIEAKARLEAAP